MSEPVADERDHEHWVRSEALRSAIAANPNGAAYQVVRDAKVFLAFLLNDEKAE